MNQTPDPLERAARMGLDQRHQFYQGNGVVHLDKKDFFTGLFVLWVQPRPCLIHDRFCAVCQMVQPVGSVRGFAEFPLRFDMRLLTVKVKS